jgi:hypothetical protein
VPQEPTISHSAGEGGTPGSVLRKARFNRKLNYAPIGIV